MTVPPLLGSSPLRLYKKCEVGVLFFLNFLHMACNYENEAVEKFLLPNQPNEGNFTSKKAYGAMMDVYRHNHACVLEVHEWWKQGEQIEDVHWEAAANKEHREAEEQSRKHCHLKEEEVEAGTSACGTFSLLIFWCRSHVCS